MEQQTNEPTAALPVNPSPAMRHDGWSGENGGASQSGRLAHDTATAPAPATRHDGWTGERIATFCESLAETAVVAEACDAAGMGISGAYAARRRNPLFAAAWDAALSIARERLADTLLARSMEGNVEQIYRNGELVGERHMIDNRLGLAILRRLDRLAETGLSVSRRGERAPSAPAPRQQPLDWEMMVDALRTGDPDGIAASLVMLKSNEVEEVEGPPNSLNEGDTDDAGADLWRRVWTDEDGVWMTSFAPPPGFDGYQKGEFQDFGYERECTPEEAELLAADQAEADAEGRAEEDDLRDGFFAMLREDRELFAAG